MDANIPPIMRLPTEVWERALDALLGPGPVCQHVASLRPRAHLRAAASIRLTCRAWRGARRTARRCFEHRLPTGLAVCGAHMQGEAILWRQIWAATGTCNANPFWVSTSEGCKTAYRLQALARRHGLPFAVLGVSAPGSRAPGVCVRVMNSDMWWKKYQKWKQREFNKNAREPRRAQHTT